jgi:hypothetical protein
MGAVERAEGAPGEGGSATLTGVVAFPPHPVGFADSASPARGEALKPLA